MSATSGDSEGSSPLYAENESPLFGRFQRPPNIQFQELCTVASSSDSSPMQEVMTTPHLQIKKLQKELAHDGDIIDELENELAHQNNIITEKEGQICQLHHRLERMLRQNEELEKDHKVALLELQEKNERLLHRVHEVIKQCQELKTDNSQKERKLDELTEENGTLSVQVRYASAQLATAKEEVVKLSVAHESAQVEWKSRVEFLKKELCDAVAQKDCLGEEVQILQGKISVLEDELLKAQSQERGEILGPILESDNLKQEVAELSLKFAQLQDTISFLEKEKAEELEMTKHQEMEHRAEVLSLRDELSSQILAKQTLNDLYGKLEEKVEILQRQVETAKHDAEAKEHLVLSLNQNLKQMEVLCLKNEKDTLESHQAKEDLQNRNTELVVEKQRLEESHKNMETLKNTNEHLSSLVQSLQRECDASQRIQAELEAKLNKQCNSIHSLEEISQQRDKQNEELQEQLRRKSETVEHYKSQVEKAKTHYNSKKQLLVDAQDINKCLENSLEATKREVKALETELTLAKMETNQAKAKEKILSSKVKSLEAQMTDRQQTKKMLRDEHNRGHDAWKETSTDSLEFELNDSLNTNSDSAVPGESSTPLQRSSERLAAKRHVTGAESMETLYFTPLSQQAKSRKAPYNNATKSKLETSITSFSDLVVDSAKKITESARRRRTTQFINITMTKNSEESFTNLQSTHSQPNLAVRHSRPPTMDLSEDSSISKADTLQSLPGYRRSAVVNAGPKRAASTFCIGAENEPEHAADDWMRIAQLQARNKACLPHLKSSYPLESRPSLGPSFMFTDEDMRSGDPDETIRRASMIPAQIMDSVSSHRFSLAPGLSSSHGATQSQRATMLPSQIRSSTRANAHVNENTRITLASKRRGPNLQNADMPEAKKLASCFQRPITPRAKSNNQNQPPASPVERRQSVMFSVLNTPKSNTRGDSRLQRGLNRLRNSARKSPAAGSRALRSSMASNSRTPDSALRKSPRNHTAINKKIKFRS